MCSNNDVLTSRLAYPTVNDRACASSPVIEFPESGLVQGVEEYLRDVAQRRGVDGEVAQRLRTVLTEWDAGAARPPVDRPGPQH